MSWYNPVTWWNDTAGKAGRIATDIKNWVLDAVRSAVNLVENDVVDLTGFAVNLYESAIHEAESLAGAAERGVGAAVGYAENLFNRAEHDALSWANSAIGTAENLYNRAEHDAQAWANDALHGAEGLFNRVEHDALTWANDAVGTAEALYNRAERDALSWFGAAEKFATREAARLASAAYNLIVKDFVAPFLPAWHALVKSIEWISWFATHPFKLVHNVEHDVIDWSRQLPRDVGHVLEGASGRSILDEVTRWLG